MVSKNKKFVISIKLLIFGCICWANLSLAAVFAPHATYQVCFTPGGRCTNLIRNLIDSAKHQILIQGYVLTSKPIIQALKLARERNVTVKIMLDGKNYRLLAVERRLMKSLLNKGAQLWLNYNFAKAHDKIIIVDNCEIETGSFNYSYRAEFQNTENIIIIHDSSLANKYATRWQKLVKRLQPITS